MDPSYITPFIASIQNVFSTMLHLDVRVGEPTLKTSPAPTYDISGIIGMTGEVMGTVVLSFPSATASKVVSLFAGQEIAPEHPDFADAVGELVNMVSGNAKGMFKGRKASISCPSVVMGKNHQVARLKDIPCVVIPCSTDCGDLSIEVAIQETPSPTPAAAGTASA